MVDTSIFEKLQHSGVVDASSEDQLSLTAEYRIATETLQEELSDSSEELSALVDADIDESFLNVAAVIRGSSVRMAAVYLTLVEFVQPATPSEILNVLLVVDQLYASRPRSDGAPDSFVPVRGDQLSVIVDIYETAIIYCWLDDCDPCDLLREDFDAIFDGRVTDIGLFAVYGPEWAELLQEEFEVVGGPVILFVESGTVETRFVGAYPRKTLKKEVNRLRNGPEM